MFTLLCFSRDTTAVKLTGGSPVEASAKQGPAKGIKPWRLEYGITPSLVSILTDPLTSSCSRHRRDTVGFLARDPTVCTACGAYGPSEIGICEVCGQVALRLLGESPPQAAYRTPMVKSKLADGLYLKLEGASPTGTFKDRIMAQLVSEAQETGARGAVVASSGNAAVAASAACRQAGLPLLVIVPLGTPQVKLRPVHARNVPIVTYGDDPSAAYRLARHISRKFGLAELASTFYMSASEWACRSIGHEIVEQLGTAPVAVSAAVSIGPALVGTGNGIVEATGMMPALLAGQSAGCAPIARAFLAGSNRVQPWTGPVDTQAGSIADRLTGYAHEAELILNLARESGGFVHAYDDQALVAARHDLLAVDGVDAELASVTALCAALEWVGDNPVVAVITGSGWRDTLTGGETMHASIREFVSEVGQPGILDEVQSCVEGRQAIE